MSIIIVFTSYIHETSYVPLSIHPCVYPKQQRDVFKNFELGITL